MHSTDSLASLLEHVQGVKKTLFILCGYPYSGKSYIAAHIRKQSDVVYVSVDSIFHRRGFDWDSNQLPSADEWEEIFEESYEETRRALIEGKCVLYDSTNHTIVSRDRLREVAHSVGADTKVLYVKSSIETVWKRWEENQKNRTRSVVNRELVQITIDAFEEPIASESVIVINNS